MSTITPQALRAKAGVLVCVDAVDGDPRRLRSITDLFGVEPIADAAEARRRVEGGALAIVVDADDAQRDTLATVTIQQRHRITFDPNRAALPVRSMWVSGELAEEDAVPRRLIAFVGASEWNAGMVRRVLRPTAARDRLFEVPTSHSRGAAIDASVQAWVAGCDAGRWIAVGARTGDLQVLRRAAADHRASLHVIRTRSVVEKASYRGLSSVFRIGTGT